MLTKESLDYIRQLIHEISLHMIDCHGTLFVADNPRTLRHAIVCTCDKQWDINRRLLSTQSTSDMSILQDMMATVTNPSYIERFKKQIDKEAEEKAMNAKPHNNSLSFLELADEE